MTKGTRAPASYEVTTNSAGETEKFGEGLAQRLKCGDVLALTGPLGAGKTCLTRGIARGLGCNERMVKSPSFVLLHIYTGGTMPLYHFDAYRLKDEQDLLDIGCEDIFSDDGVSVVEWADNVPGCLPGDAITITLRIIGENVRQICVKGAELRPGRIEG